MQKPESEDISTTLGLNKTTKKPPRAKTLLIAVAALIIILFISIFIMMQQSGPAVTYQTQPASIGTITATVSATGNLEPTNNVTVGSELSGTIKTVEVDENDTVESGQILARLDTRKLSAQVRQSQAALASAKASVLEAQATLEEDTRALKRLKKAYEISGGKIPSQEELDTAEAALMRARADVASAEASVTEAEASLEQNETDLAKSVITSPINGTILTRDIEPGQTVAASLEAPTLFTIAQDLSHMELNVSVDEADVGRIKKGQQATFSVDAYPDRTFEASIKRVSYGATTTDGVVTYETELEVDNSELILRPGMTATAVITVEKAEDVLLVPNAALRFTPETGAMAQEQKKSMISRILPGPRMRAQTTKTATSTGSTHQKLWILENGQPVPADVETGITNGVLTVIVKGPVQSGTPVIIGSMSVSK